MSYGEFMLLQLDVPRPILDVENIPDPYLPEKYFKGLEDLEDNIVPRPHVTFFASRKWMLVKDYEYRGVKIPAGFVSDGASIPKFLRWFYNPHDPRTLLPALVHDWLYFCKFFGDSKSGRRIADKIFKDLLYLEQNRNSKVFAYFKAVDLFGGIGYRSDKEEHKDVRKMMGK